MNKDHRHGSDSGGEDNKTVDPKCPQETEEILLEKLKINLCCLLKKIDTLHFNFLYLRHNMYFN